MAHIVIIGNGIAGITCARHIRKRSNDDITIISGETDHFFSRTALMYVYMGHMRFEHTKPYEDWFWEKNRLNLKRAWVNEVNPSDQTIQFEDGSKMSYDKLVLATGSVPNRFGWSGQDLPGVQGLYSYQDLQLLEENTRSKDLPKRIERAVIVGGGLIGIELAEMLRSEGIDVIMLVRESHYWGKVLSADESELVMRQAADHGVDIRLKTELEEILPDENGRVGSIRTTNGEVIQCEFVGLTAGVKPNVSFLQNSGININKGVLINQRFETNQPAVFAIGDCAEFIDPPSGISSLNQVWYTGRIMGETLALNLTGSSIDYQPGPWFNSAKFFDLEYQTYGSVTPQDLPNRRTFFWQDSAASVCVKVQFDSKSYKILGINSLGVRINHDEFNDWLRNSRPVVDVISRFKDAVFDAEFTRDYVPQIQREWNLQNPDLSVSVQRKKYLLF